MNFSVTKGRYEMTARIEHDDVSDAPWEREDGHGPVTEWTTTAKAPGQRVLCCDGKSRLLYDFAEAVRIARKDRWDAPPYGEGTRGQRAARAAEADFQRLRDWCNGQWHYVGVVISVTSDGEEIDTNAASLWGIESDCREYLLEIARELADEAYDQVSMGQEEFFFDEVHELENA